MKKLCVLAAMFIAVSGAQALIIDSSFENLDFDASTSGNFPDGFDSGTGYDIPGWQDFGTITDAGVEFEGAWWSPYEQYSAFVKQSNGAYNVSSYLIQDGDEFDVSVMAKGWQTYANTPGAELTITLFYGSDPNANALGSFNTGVLPQGDTFETWTLYGDTFAATAGSVGQTLGVSVLQTSAVADTFAQFDELSVDVIPEPATLGLLGLAGVGMFAMRRRFRR